MGLLIDHGADWTMLEQQADPQVWSELSKHPRIRAVALGKLAVHPAQATDGEDDHAAL
jgi:hypothetical protein